MQNNMPKILIIVPIYNTDKYLNECLDCIVNQIYKNLEVILSIFQKICHVINSNDNSHKIITILGIKIKK